MSRQLESRIDKLEAARFAGIDASIAAWTNWVLAHSTRDEAMAYWRVLSAAWSLPANPSMGDPRPDDLDVALAIERRGPPELIAEIEKAGLQIARLFLVTARIDV